MIKQKAPQRIWIFKTQSSKKTSSPSLLQSTREEKRRGSENQVRTDLPTDRPNMTSNHPPFLGQGFVASPNCPRMTKMSSSIIHPTDMVIFNTSSKRMASLSSTIIHPKGCRRASSTIIHLLYARQETEMSSRIIHPKVSMSDQCMGRTARYIS